MVVEINYRFVQVKSIAECSKETATLKKTKIGCQDQLSLNAFWPSLSYQLLLKFLFCLFYAGFTVCALRACML